MSEESGFVKVFLTIVFTTIGIILGGLLGSFGIYYLCLITDTTNGAGGGDGYLTIGWVFLYFTIPIGVLVGGGLGLSLSIIFLLQGENTTEGRILELKDSDFIPQRESETPLL